MTTAVDEDDFYMVLVIYRFHHIHGLERAKHIRALLLVTVISSVLINNTSILVSSLNVQSNKEKSDEGNDCHDLQNHRIEWY